MTEQDKLIERARYDARAQSLIAASAVSEMVTEVTLGSETMPAYLQSPYIFYEQKIAELVRPNHRVLELGAGVGLHTRALLQTGAQVVASDISQISLNLLKQRFQNTPGNLETEVADMERLPFEASSFDVIVSAGSLSYGDPHTVDAEIRRVLRPGGTLICVDSLNHNPIYRVNRWLHYLRGERSKSTLKRMPDLTRITAVSGHFQKSSIYYFGALTFAMPLLTRILGSNSAQKLSDDFDSSFGVKRSAFKFVFVGSGAGLSDGVQSLTTEEPIYHFVRFEQLQNNSKAVINKESLVLALNEHLPMPYRVMQCRPRLFGGIYGLPTRGRNFIRFLMLNNMFGGDLFLILVYDATGNLIHRSTVTARDFRRPHLPGGYEITQVWTDDEYRGKGIAVGVLRALMQAAPTIQLHWCVRASNFSSIRVVEKLGFKLIETYTSVRQFGITFFNFSQPLSEPKK